MEKTKMKQNKKHIEINEQIIIAPVFFIICIILLITLCSVSSLAYEYPDDTHTFVLCEAGDTNVNLFKNYTYSCTISNTYYAGCMVVNGMYYPVVISNTNDFSGISGPFDFSNIQYDSTYEIYYSGFYYSTSSPSWNGVLSYSSYSPSELCQLVRNTINNSSSSTGDVIPLTTSYYTLDSGAYYKASENDKSAFALVGDIDNGFTVVVGSIDPNCFIYKATDSSVSPVSLFRSNNLNLINFYSNQNAGMIHPVGIDLSAFDTASDAETAIYNYLLDEGGTPTATSSYSLSYNLPPGNVMFIDVSSAVGTITLETSSGIAVSQNEFNNNNNQTIGYLASFPDSFTLPLSGTDDIQWTASGNPTILGTYQNFKYTSAINSGGNQYLVIVNPTYDNLAISEGNLQADNPSATNSYIDIRCSAQNFYIFSLDAQISFSDGSWQLDSESSNTQFTGTYDPTTQTWNTTDSITGLPAQPTVGGANDIPTTDPAQAASNFTSWLKNFLSSFISIFDAGKTAITTLVGYAQPFFNTIGSLYSWLPTPVYAVLVSGLTLVVIVGVIKVFL